jgi:hypothetical protein
MQSVYVRDARRPQHLQGAAFLYPYLHDKSGWPYAKDVEHFESLPVRSPGLLFAGHACGREEYLQLWARLNPDPTDPEIIRNYPVRQPLLWFAEGLNQASMFTDEKETKE